MDNLQQYIDMCREATEIVYGREWQEGDFVVDASWLVSKYRIHCDDCRCEFGRWGDDAIWLPRQDQLQAMIDFDTVSRDDIYRLAAHFESDDYVTWEQLWLAFVMKERFNKHWNGTTWEVNNESP